MSPAVTAMSVAKHLMQRSRQFRWLRVGHYRAAAHVAEPFPDVTDVHRHNRDIARQRLFHNVGTALVYRRQEQGIGRIQPPRHFLVRHTVHQPDLGVYAEIAEAADGLTSQFRPLPGMSLDGSK